MQDPGDFSLRIVVMPPESAPVDEGATTSLFPRSPLPGVNLSHVRVRREQLQRPPTPPPLPPARHAWLPKTARPRAPGITPPPPPLRPHASPLSDDDGRRMQRRIRAHRRIRWAQTMLRRFQFVEGDRM
jgi:hypothetical protein